MQNEEQKELPRGSHVSIRYDEYDVKIDIVDETRREHTIRMKLEDAEAFADFMNQIVAKAKR